MNVAEPGMFFKLTDGNLTKVGPVAINTTGNAPNSSPGGATGNAVGEQWLDGRSAFSASVLKVYDGSTWKAASGFTVNDTTGIFSLSRELQTRTYVGTGTGQYGYLQVNSGPVADETAITTPVAGMMRFDTTNNVMRAYNGTIWMNIGDMTGEDISCENLTVLGDTTLGNDCGNDTLDVQAVSTFYCNVTIGTNSANDFIVNSEAFFRSGVDLTLQSDLRFHAANDTSNYVGFQAPSSIASSLTWTLPGADGSPGDVLTTSGTGTLSWQAASGGGGASVTVDDSAPLAPNLGDLWFDSSTGRLNVYYNESTMVPPVGSDSQWVDASPASTGLADIRILDDLASSFNGVTTTFTMQQGGVNISAVSPQQLIIDLGGVVQRPITDYTITGSQLTFTTAPQAGLTFSGRLLGNAMTLNAPASGSVTPPILDRAYVEVAGDQMTGDLGIGGTVASPNIELNADGTSTFSDDLIVGDTSTGVQVNPNFTGSVANNACEIRFRSVNNAETGVVGLNRSSQGNGQAFSMTTGGSLQLGGNSNTYFSGTVSTTTASGPDFARLQSDASNYGLRLYRSSSLRAHKTDIQSLADPVSLTKALRPVTFKSAIEADLAAPHGGDLQVGFIAEEVEAIHTGLCTYGDGNLSGVCYDRMGAVAIGALKEAIARIETLESEVAALKGA